MKNLLKIGPSVVELRITIFLLCTVTSLYSQFDVENGPIEIYYPNGQISSRGFVKDGKPDGFWQTYYVTGIIKSEGKRSNFLLDSTWNFYNQSGDLVEEINYQLGKKSGFTIKYSYDNPDKPGQKTIISKELYINDIREGQSNYYYNTGELQKIIYFSNGKKEGYVKEYDKKGSIITLNQFKDNYLISRERINRIDNEGLKQGTYKSFFNDGLLKREENYLNGELHGYYREFDEQGKLLQTFRYEKGAVVEEIDEEAKDIIDFKRTYDEEGRLLFSGGYREGIPIGIHRFFDTTGVVINAYIYNEKGVKLSEGVVDEQGLRKGEWKDFYETGELRAHGNYRGNKQSGEWVYFFKTGGIEQTGSFLNGRYNGSWVWYYDTGEIWRDENYFNGREDGYCIEYDKSGNIIEEGGYINGEKDGKWVYIVGDNKEEGNYIIGLKEGKWIQYYEDGSKKFVGSFLQGLLDGKQIYYYTDGSIKEEQFYQSGIRDKTWRKYDELGNIEITISYKDNIENRINGVKVRLPESDIKVIK